MSNVELRPLSLGELLDRAFALYRRNFWLFFGIMVIPSCLILPFQFYFLRAWGSPFPWGRATEQKHLSPYAFAFLLVIWLVYLIVHGATTYGVSEVYFGRRSSIRGAYGRIRGRTWSLIGLFINVGIRVTSLMILMLIASVVVAVVVMIVVGGNGGAPGTFVMIVIFGIVLLGMGLAVWLSLRYAIAVPAMLLEDTEGLAAIRRSVQLSRGRRGPLFMAFLLTAVFSYAGVLIFQGPFYVAMAMMRITNELPNWMALCLSVSGSIGGAVTGPLMMIVLVLWYYDLRIRKEGFDLQVLMTSLDEVKPPDSASRV